MLTMHEVVATLDQVMMLNIVASGDGQDAKIVPGIDGDVVWYSSIVDARAALGRCQGVGSNVRTPSSVSETCRNQNLTYTVSSLVT